MCHTRNDGGLIMLWLVRLIFPHNRRPHESLLATNRFRDFENHAAVREITRVSHQSVDDRPRNIKITKSPIAAPFSL